MMFNLPLPGGTTGHAVGVGIAAIVLGPWASILAISIALVIQALLFGDGGITAIGANCFNMAILGSLTAYGIYRLVAGSAPIESPRRVFAAALAGYLAINVSAVLPVTPEPKFFLVDHLYEKGLRFYSDTWFAANGDARLAGEKTTNYLESAVAADRIARDLPGRKLIFILREPADRAYSNYLWSRMNGLPARSVALRQNSGFSVNT